MFCVYLFSQTLDKRIPSSLLFKYLYFLGMTFNHSISIPTSEFSRNQNKEKEGGECRGGERESERERERERTNTIWNTGSPGEPML
jgi:hypothetical protein